MCATAQRTPSATKDHLSVLNGLSCINANDCVAVGYFAKQSDSVPDTLVEAWNGLVRHPISFSSQRTEQADRRVLHYG